MKGHCCFNQMTLNSQGCILSSQVTLAVPGKWFLLSISFLSCHFAPPATPSVFLQADLALIVV